MIINDKPFRACGNGLFYYIYLLIIILNAQWNVWKDETEVSVDEVIYCSHGKDIKIWKQQIWHFLKISLNGSVILSTSWPALAKDAESRLKKREENWEAFSGSIMLSHGPIEGTCRVQGHHRPHHTALGD